jgi:hypothetical protein
VALPTETKRKAAMDIVLAEEETRGAEVVLPGSWAKEKESGCDLLSTPPGAAEPDHVEVKGWGEPFLSSSGKFLYAGQDIRASQFEAAKKHANYRIEIVANLDAYLRGEGPYQRLTLKAEAIVARAVPRLYDVLLEGLEPDVRTINEVGRTLG